MPNLTADEATKRGYAYVNGKWQFADGRKMGLIAQHDPSAMAVADPVWKDLLKVGAVAGGFAAPGLLAGSAMGPSAAASAAPSMGTPTLTSLPGMTSGTMTTGGMTAAGGGMNFTDILKKIGDISGIAQNVGTVAGGAAQEKASTEQNQALLDTTRNSQLLSRYGTNQNAESDAGRLNLDRNKFDLDSEGTRMKRALIGALLGQVGSAPQGKFSIGSAAPTASLMASRAKEQALAGNTYQNGSVLTPPELSQPKAGSGSGFLNNLALFSSLLGAGGAKPPDLSAKQ